jgi:hypothetical protein
LISEKVNPGKTKFLYERNNGMEVRLWFGGCSLIPGNEPQQNYKPRKKNKWIIGIYWFATNRIF